MPATSTKRAGYEPDAAVVVDLLTMSLEEGRLEQAIETVDRILRRRLAEVQRERAQGRESYWFADEVTKAHAKLCELADAVQCSSLDELTDEEVQS